MVKVGLRMKDDVEVKDEGLRSGVVQEDFEIRNSICFNTFIFGLHSLYSCHFLFGSGEYDKKRGQVKVKSWKRNQSTYSSTYL